MSRMYTINAENQSASAAIDLLEITVATQKPVEIVGIDFNVTTELQEAQEEWLRLTWTRGNTTSGSGGGTYTPTPVDPSDGVAGFTVETANTTAASAGTAVIVASFACQVRAGYTMWYPDACGPRAVNGSLLVLRFAAAPADALNYNLTVWAREL